MGSNSHYCNWSLAADTVGFCEDVYMIRLLAQDDTGTLRQDCICSENSTTWQFSPFLFKDLFVCLFAYVCMDSLPASISVRHAYAGCLCTAEETIGAPGI